MFNGFTAEELKAVISWMEDQEIASVDFKVGFESKYIFTDDKIFYDIKDIMTDYY